MIDKIKMQLQWDTSPVNKNKVTDGKKGFKNVSILCLVEKIFTIPYVNVLILVGERK